MTEGPTTPQPRLRRARFAELTPFEVYGLCRLRVDVFVVEQECPYPELDGRDLEPATVHLWFESAGEVAATIRVLAGRIMTRFEESGRATAPTHSVPSIAVGASAADTRAIASRIRSFTGASVAGTGSGSMTSPT